ncbi:hypothetical protein D9X30_5549 [Cupriavidus sp. U2]|nr:hypothetical protein D9X30_5549 [Cupriavidus sp. U2]
MYYSAYPIGVYFDTPQEACDNLNNHLYASDFWRYDDADRQCIHATGSFHVGGRLRCAPDASEPGLDIGPEDQRCGGPFFWAGSTPVRDIEDESCPLGNPVAVGTGVKTQKELDIPGTEHVPALERTYRSEVRFAAADGFGPNWTHQWNRQIQNPGVSPDSISVLRGDGSARTFQKSETGWIAVSGRDAITLTSGTNGSIGWRYFNATDHSFETYDARGRLLHIVARNGRTITLTYGEGGQLSRVENHFKQSYTFQYDTAGRIASITDPTNRTTRYEYNPWGMLAVVVHPDGTRRTYHYENSPYRSIWTHQLTGITDEAGVRYSTYEYDAQGRIKSTERAGGVDRVTLVYLSELETARTFPYGSPATLYRQIRIGNRLRPASIEGPPPEAGGTKFIVYDATGNVARTVDFEDRETQYTYDQQGRETQRIENPGLPDKQVTSTEWHTGWNLPTRIARPNRVDTIEYDSVGQPILHTWFATADATGEMGYGAPRVDAIASVAWTYDHNGLLTSLTGREDTRIVDRWTFSYDAQGNLATATDVNRRTSRALAYDGAGRLLEAIDLNGIRLKYVYDARARPVAYHYGANLTTYAYDAIGQLTRQTGPHGRETHYKYDAAHRLVDVQENGSSLVGSDPFIEPGAVDHTDPAADNVGANPFDRWFGWLTRIFTWLFSPAQAQAVPVPPQPHVLGAATSVPDTYTPSPWDNLAYGTGSRRPWEWLVIWTQRIVNICTGKSKREEHRGRIHAQGVDYPNAGIGDAEAWAQAHPLPVVAGLVKLDAVVARMTKRQYHNRTQAIDRARKYMIDSANAGGIGQRKRTFHNDKIRNAGGSERVDIDVLSGRAFIP